MREVITTRRHDDPKSASTLPWPSLSPWEIDPFRLFQVWTTRTHPASWPYIHTISTVHTRISQHGPRTGPDQLSLSVCLSVLGAGSSGTLSAGWIYGVPKMTVSDRPHPVQWNPSYCITKNKPTQDIHATKSRARSGVGIYIYIHLPKPK